MSGIYLKIRIFRSGKELRYHREFRITEETDLGQKGQVIDLLALVRNEIHEEFEGDSADWDAVSILIKPLRLEATNAS